jgi:hypothetical protein
MRRFPNSLLLLLRLFDRLLDFRGFPALFIIKQMHVELVYGQWKRRRELRATIHRIQSKNNSSVHLARLRGLFE